MGLKMPIVVACQCGQQFRAKDEFAGRQMKCPKCGSVIQVPGGNAAQQPAAPQGGGSDLDALLQMDQTAGMGGPAGFPQQGMPQGGFPQGGMQQPGFPQQGYPQGGYQQMGGYPGGAKKKSSSPVPLIVGICAVGVIIIAGVIIAMKLSGGDDENQQDQVAQAPEPIGSEAERNGQMGRQTTSSNAGPGPTNGGNSGSSNSGTGAAGTDDNSGETETADPPEPEVELTEWDLVESTNKWMDKGEDLRGFTVVDSNLPEIYAYSWMTHILPYVGEQATYDKFDFETVFIEGQNREPISKEIEQFLNPNQETTRFEGLYFTGLALTHFVGISGAEDSRQDLAARFERSDPRAGVFGYEEIAGLGQISDGTSNTLLLIGSEKTAGPWVSGGGSTIRGARKGENPYIGGFYGFWSEGLDKPGALAALADGSVREVPEEIDPAVFRSLSTIAGGETDVDLAALPRAEDNSLPLGIKEKLIEEAKAKANSSSQSSTQVSQPGQPGQGGDQRSPGTERSGR